jgi:hypothetical protein
VTSPNSVGEISVEVLGDAKALIKKLRGDLEKGLKETDVDKAIKDAIGKKPIKVPVEADADTAPLQEKVRRTRVPKVKVPLDPDTASIPEKVKKTRIPKVPVPLDPVLQAFQQEVRRQTAALSRQAIKIPVGGDTAGLRAELSAQLAAIQTQSRIKVPTEPAEKAAYEAKLKAQLAEVAARVKQTVKVEAKVDAKVDKKDVAGLGSALKSLPTSGVGLLKTAFESLSQSMAESSNTAIRMGGNLIGAVSGAAGPVGTVVSGLIGLASAMGIATAAATFAAPAMSALAGALAALPGILAGVGAGFGTLSLGFKGISDAFKPKAGGGGGGGGEDAASRARRIAGAERGVEAARRGIAAATRGLQSANRGLEQAERGVADAQARVSEAQRRALQAQQAVNRARKEAKEDIEDLNRSLSGAKLSEEDATLRVTEALRELNKAKESGVLPDIQRADLEYRQAQQALEEAKDATEDLGEAAKDANDLGVEGSDKVQDALQDQVDANNAVKDAIRGVADAQVAVIEAQNGVLSANDALKSSYDGLASAQDSLAEAQKKAAAAGGGGALAEVVKLAPAAQRFVDAIKALKPAFESLRLDVQQRLFAGLDKTVTRLGEAWIPALRITLGSYADTFNGFFKNLGASLTAPKFITDLQLGAEAGRKAFFAIGDAVTSKLVPAFGALSSAAAPFIETLGREIADIVTEFSEWVLQGEKTDALKDFFATASESMHDLFTTGKLVGKIIGNLFQIITGGDQETGKSSIDSFNDGLTQLNDYLSDPTNQQSIRDFFGSLKDGLADVAKYIQAFKDFVDKFRDIKKALFGDDSGTASSAGASIGKALVAGIATGVKIGFETTWGIIAGFFWSGPDSLLGRIKSGLGIASPSTLTTAMGVDLIRGLINGIGNTVAALLAKAATLPGIIRKGIGDAAKILAAQGRNVVVGLINGVAAQYGALRTRVLGLRTTILNVFSTAGTFLVNAGRNTVAGLANGISALYGALRTRALGLRATITNALAGAGTWLVNAGRNAVIGLLNGIASLGGWLYNNVVAFVKNNVQNALSQALQLGSPSKLTFGMGAFTGQGLALGLESEESRVARAAAAIAAAALPQVGAAGLDLFGNADAAITRSLQVAGANTLQASWAPGATGDPILDAFKKVIKFSHSGNVQAALGSS